MIPAGRRRHKSTRAVMARRRPGWHNAGRSSGCGMAYLVLARKWRPKRFAELVGQEHVVRALGNALESGRVHHAFLFTGTRGVGKTTIARIFAKSLNCEQGTSADPCGVCNVCLDVDASLTQPQPSGCSSDGGSNPQRRANKPARDAGAICAEPVEVRNFKHSAPTPCSRHPLIVLVAYYTAAPSAPKCRVHVYRCI